jgi:hypothetical protein
VQPIELTETIQESRLVLPTFIPRRYRPGKQDTWSGHLAFANDLLADIRPSLLVELGTHYGESYFGFCQSVAENAVDCLCYAVDHWLGDAHAGFYGEEVIEDVRQHNDTYYRNFSYLLRMSFDDARLQFADESVDLLHIDGMHTYDAGKHDFWTWLPKVKPGGIILLHDVVVRHADFGIWRLWDELRSKFPNNFAFHHSWGLGVLQKPGPYFRASALLELLFQSSPHMQEQIRRYYGLYASHLERILRAEDQTVAPCVDRLVSAEDESGPILPNVQVYVAGEGGYSEEESSIQSIEFGQSKTFEFPHGVGDKPLRVDPVDCPSVVELDRISVVSLKSGAVLWNAADRTSLCGLTISESAAFLSHESKCLLFACANDPYLLLPRVHSDGGGVRVEISLRLRQLETVLEILNTTRRKTDTRIADLLAEVRSAQTERALTAAELRQASSEKNEARRELRRIEELSDSSRLSLESERSSNKALQAEVLGLRNDLQGERGRRSSMECSWSWRVTKPMRSFGRMLGLK